MELIADCHGVTEVNLTTALGFCSMTSSIETLERAHELVTCLSVEVFPGALQTEQKIGGWREALENEMNLKDSEAYHRPAGSKYLVGSNSAPYCNSRYPTYVGDGCQDTAGVGRSTLICAKRREVGQNVGKVV